MVGPVFAPAGAQIGWLVLAVVLHVCGQVSRGVAWRGVLAATWPDVTRRRACAWYVCGAGLSGVLSPRGGDAVRVTLARRELRDATWPALTGTLCAEASFETISGLTMMLAAVALGVGSLHAPPVALLAAAALAAPAAALLAARSARVRRTVREVGRGAAVLRRPGHCARHVLPYQAGARVLRLGSAACFLLAFGLPVAPAIVVAAVLAQGSGAAVPIPGAGLAAIGAALLVALPFAAGHPLDGGALASLAVVWPVTLTRRGRGHLGRPARAPVRRTHAAGARARRALAAATARAHHPVTAALGWGALAASSLVVGALLGLARTWPDRAVGIVLAFGAGALVSAVSFDLAEEGLNIGSGAAVGGGLAVGALTYFVLDRLVERRGSGGGAGPALALGAFLDGIPEQAVLGIGLAGGEGVSVSLLAAIFVSNLPEAIGSASDMRASGTKPATIRRLWLAVAVVCTLASVAGFAIADTASGDLKAAINGFAAGALLVMLIDSMIPEAARKAGDVAGLVTVLGFAVATAL